MPETPTAGTPYFSVTHRAVSWPLRDWMTVIGGGPTRPPECRDLTQEYPETKTLNVSMSEFRQLFALRRLIEDEQFEGMVGVSHYRRFAVSDPGISAEGGDQQLVDPATFQALPDQVFLGDGQQLIVPSFVDFGKTTLVQYAQAHEARDLMYFFALAVDLGVVTGDAASLFLSQGGMIACASIGVFPGPWLVSALTALEQVSRAFEANFLIERGAYQGRTIAFCCERLMALLVQQLAIGWPDEKLSMCRPLIISEDGNVVSSTI
jgi:hypothetical protein